MYIGDYSQNKRPLFGERKGSIKWEKVAGLVFAGFAILFFVMVLYQSSRISVLTLDKERLGQDVTRLMRESATTRASLSAVQQEKDVLEVRVTEYVENADILENTLNRQRLITEAIQEDLRKNQLSLAKCESNAKRREEELEAELAAVTQKKNDLSIRVDTEHAIGAEWSKKVAEERLARSECEQKLNALEAKFSSQGDHQDAENTVHEEDPMVQMGRKAGGAVEGEKQEEQVQTQ